MLKENIILDHSLHFNTSSFQDKAKWHFPILYIAEIGKKWDIGAYSYEKNSLR